VATVARVVGVLVDVGARDEAVELCLDAACPGLASDLLVELAPGLLAASRSRVLERWLARLPPEEQARHEPLLADIRRARSRRDGMPRPRPDTAHHSRRLRVHRRRYPQDRRDVHADDAGRDLVIRVRLMGTVDVALDGRLVECWHGRVGRTALAYVLLQNRRVPPDELSGALWPDVPEAVARNRLHVALHRLRADLATVDPRPVLVYQQGYTVDPAIQVELDTQRFERLGGEGDEALRVADKRVALDSYLAAVDCYRGELLAGQRDDDWALLAREHYRVRLLDVLGKAAHLAFDLDRQALAVHLGQRLLALDFCREDLHRLLMRAYARLGQPQLALRQYQMCIRQLQLEFGLKPAPATVELYDRVRSQAPV
jgi:DNA-binding SARP family transcriptional activator